MSSYRYLLFVSARMRARFISTAIDAATFVRKGFISGAALDCFGARYELAGVPVARPASSELLLRSRRVRPPARGPERAALSCRAHRALSAAPASSPRRCGASSIAARYTEPPRGGLFSHHQYLLRW